MMCDRLLARREFAGLMGVAAASAALASAPLSWADELVDAGGAAGAFDDGAASAESDLATGAPDVPASAPDAAPDAAPEDAPLDLQALPALRVSGTRLVDASGNTVMLRGISTHGLQWFPQYVNLPLFRELRTTWGANVVRLALYTAEGGYLDAGKQADLRTLIRNGVSYAVQAGLYVIVDWHILSDGNPSTNIDAAKKFFEWASKEFAGTSNVLYEICNEPNGGVTWADVKRYAEGVIPVIRKNAPGAVVLVGSPTWSQDIHLAADDPLDPKKFPNVMYTLHFYAATHKDDLRNRLSACVGAGLPVFVSEFGICDASGNGSIDEASANAWIKTCEQLKVPWVMWSLCNKAESASTIKSGVSKTSGFAASDLAQSGTWLRARLKQYGSTTPAVFTPVGTGRFADVPDNHWGATSGVIDASDDAGLVRGSKNGKYRVFMPDDPLTRAQAATILARLAGDAAQVDDVLEPNATPWTDVPGNKWYTAAMNWAYTHGVLTGYGDGTVRPDGFVTREELCVMLTNFRAGHGRLELPEEWHVWDPPQHEDTWKSHDWAHASLAWCMQRGIIGGSRYLNPLGTATRTEAAKMFLTFAQAE